MQGRALYKKNINNDKESNLICEVRFRNCKEAKPVFKKQPVLYKFTSWRNIVIAVLGLLAFFTDGESDGGNKIWQ